MLLVIYFSTDLFGQQENEKATPFDQKLNSKFEMKVILSFCVGVDVISYTFYNCQTVSSIETLNVSIRKKEKIFIFFINGQKVK